MISETMRNRVKHYQVSSEGGIIVRLLSVGGSKPDRLLLDARE